MSPRALASPALLARAALLSALLAGCDAVPEKAPPSPPPPAAAPFEPERVVFEGRAMGTSVVLQAFSTPELGASAVRARLEKAHAEILRLESLMTTWREDSEISRLNAAAGEESVEVSKETFEVLEKSVWIGGLSGGLFDVTFDAMRGLWKFDEGAEARVPERSKVDAARRKIDFRKLVLDPRTRTARLAERGMRVGLGGIAKGYAVDAAARLLEKEGLQSFFVQAGGDLFVRGKKPGSVPFRVGVRDPRSPDPDDYFATIDVTDHAFSTAGDYERSFLKDGKRYHHIIDPRTGFPGEKTRSVTVWAESALLADAIDDAVFLMGPEEGLALVESMDGVGAVIVDAKSRVFVSKRLEGKVRMLKKPTDAP